ncbi:MAG TPA: T9SS type A sorting domain-containing protein, partial [Saprospiraceae bacterium]|nr:T9SS type A sorting domain-containing protein [Saprospiraceae bacterium]
LPFEIWPNPATDRISIQYQHAEEPMTISILDLQGHVVRQKRNMVSGSDLETTTLPAGIYIVQLSNGKENGYKMLVKE